MRHRRTLGWIAAIGIATGLAACGEDPSDSPQAPRCLDQAASVDCNPLYLPETGDAYSFSDIFQNSIAGRCNERPCHDSEDPTGGLDLSTEDVAYENLLDASLDPLRVDPGDVQCGKLIVYLETPDVFYTMPPGELLSAEERCVFRQWIASGAER